MVRLGIETIILHEHATEGRTSIEKFEGKSSGVGFAVVLLTPDDEGRAVGADLQPRAGQNVILELGYFFGKLGRNECAPSRREKSSFQRTTSGWSG